MESASSHRRGRPFLSCLFGVCLWGDETGIAKSARSGWGATMDSAHARKSETKRYSWMSAYPEVSEVFEERGLGLDIEAGCDPEPGPAGHSKYRVAAVLAEKHRGENGHLEVTLLNIKKTSPCVGSRQWRLSQFTIKFFPLSILGQPQWTPHNSKNIT